MKTRDIVLIAVIGALYAVLTLGIAPLSYGAVQFRVSEFLKVFCLWNPFTAVGIAVGDIFSAMASPYLSAWEVAFMPITDILGGFLTYGVFRLMRNRYPYISMTIYALTTALAVAVMLKAFGVDAFLPLFISVGVSELVILNLAIPVGFRIKHALDSRKSRLLEETS